MNEIVTTSKSSISMLLDADRFEMAQRAGNLMAMSALFPKHLREGGEKTALANAVMVMNIADRMREDPLAVAQNVYFVHGKPGWNASYMISRANQSSRFKSGIRWEINGGDGVVEASGSQKLRDYRVVAWATLASDGSKVDAEISMEDAFLQGWTKRGRDGAPSKYETMGRQMLQYRAATLLVRLYCPEVMLGYSVVEELEDVAAAEMRDVTPSAPATDIEPEQSKSGNEPEAVAYAEVVEDEPKADQKSKPSASKKKDATAKPAEKKSDAKAEGGKGSPETEAPEEGPAASGDEVDGQVETSGVFDVSKLPDEIQGPFEQISEAYADATSIGDIEGLNGLFAEALDYMAAAHTDAREELQAREDARREELAAEEG